MLTRDQAIKAVGEYLVAKVDAESCDFTGRLMPTPNIVEFSASVPFGDDNRLTVYYYQVASAVKACEGLDDLKWVPNHYTIRGE